HPWWSLSCHPPTDGTRLRHFCAQVAVIRPSVSKNRVAPLRLLVPPWHLQPRRASDARTAHPPRGQTASAGSGHVFEGAPVGEVGGFVRGDFDVRSHPGPFPVTPALWIDCFGHGDGRFQVLVHPESDAGVSTAAGAFADDRCPAELL